MDKSFEPSAIEADWYARWERLGCFAPEGDGTPYCVLLPPPNVTGTLHMGHAFQQTIMDLLIRHARMSGRRTLWQGGTDHAGIATQKIVENQLAAEGSTRHDLGREAFVERVWAWKDESGSTITNQMRRLGASIDWSRERFTMDEGLSAAVRRVFVRWYRDGLIYRGKRLVHWDPVLQTAVSDLEVNNEERDGSMWLIRYPAADGGEGVVVATTRPETMLGDVAVAVHPEDERYAHLLGRHLELPLTGRRIPVIADAWVDREFGTGCVKITPAHDFNDFAIWQRHEQTLRQLVREANPSWPQNWEPPSVFAPDGRVVTAAHNLATHQHRYKKVVTGGWPGEFADHVIPSSYQGLDRFEARKRVLADLEAAGLLVETRKHKLMVPISQRSDAVIEPMLTDQWFVDLTRDTLPDGRPGGRRAITQPALEAVTGGAIRFVPENWTTTYVQWLENIQDWCISRQLWWGHRIPAWHDGAGNHFVGEDEADAVAWARAHGGPEPVGALTQDPDVLDTWFSSALWPFSTLGWPGDTPQRAAEWNDFQRFLPSSVLVTGFDIIFFWVARMVMASVYFAGRGEDGQYEPARRALSARIPFREVYINAIVRDAEGQKMSKSKGNTIDPLDLIDGIELPALVEKSTRALLIPQVRDKVEKRIRKEYPDGIRAVGADALRFTFAALATHGRTINFDLKRCEGYKAFCNKLWNAARFVLMNTEGFTAPAGAAVPARSEAERWILTRLSETLAEVEAGLAAYRFDLVAQALYEFTWNDYCDWFVELAKPALADGADAADAASTRMTLLHVLETLLRALHPIIPFISEAIWQEVAPKLGRGGDTISRTHYPLAGESPRDPAAAAEIGWLKEAVSGIRRIRSEMNIAPSKAIPLLVAGGDAEDCRRVAHFGPALRFLARLESVDRLEAHGEEPAAAAAVVGDLRLLIPLAGLIDLGAERARLAREIARIEGEIGKCQGKLGTETFVRNAPPHVVEQERTRLADFTTSLVALRAQAAKLGAG
jgi:valyl-tRNA synthetase